MGMQIFEASGSFDPSARGLTAGDVIDVICVGGGASGAYYYGGATSGEDGTYSASVSGDDSSIGTISSANGITMASGQTADSSTTSGGGGGGYMPGIPMYGGNGGTGCGMSGTSGTVTSPYANPSGAGNKGATGGTGLSNSNNNPPGGNGYGAGGGGLYVPRFSREENLRPTDGGNAGKIAFGSIVLQDTTALTVTVGSGGENSGNSGMHGAPGVVIVFW